MIPEIHTFLLAMTPVGELRVAIPVGLNIYNLNFTSVFVLAVLGNLVPVVFLLLFLKKVSEFLIRKSKIFKRFFDWLFARTQKRYNSKMEKYGYPALIIFVAIPLPLTGAWTASLVAFLFGIPFKKALPLIAAGILIAGIIVSGINRIGVAIEDYFGWQILTGVLLIYLIIWLMYNKIKNPKTKNTGSEQESHTPKS